MYMHDTRGEFYQHIALKYALKEFYHIALKYALKEFYQYIALKYALKVLIIRIMHDV